MGRQRINTDFREWCRRVVTTPKVRRRMEKRALDDPEYALQLAAYGWGRPPTSDIDMPMLPATVNVQILAVLNRLTPEQLEAYADRGVLPSTAA